MASTYDMVHLAAAIRKSREGKDGEPTADEVFTEAKRYGLLLKIEDRISINEQAMFNARKAVLRASLDWRKSDRDFMKYIADVKNGNIKFERQQAAKLLREVQKKGEKALKSATMHDDSMVRRAMDNARDSNYKRGLNADDALFRAIFDTDPFGDPNQRRNLNKPEHRGALRKLLGKFEEKNPGILDIDENGVVTNVDDLLSEDRNVNPLLQNGIMSEMQVRAWADEGDSNELRVYNRAMEADAEALGEVKGALNDLGAKAGELEDTQLALTDDAVKELLSSSAGMVEQVQTVLENPQTFSIDDMDALEAQMDDFKELEDSTARLKALQKKVMQEKPDRAEKLRQNMGISIASTAFQSWAADNGFDELGRIDADEDGKLDFDTYVQGRDDLPAIMAFHRQQKRGAGRYGMRKIGTGDIVQFRLNGELIQGERLKYHAADRPGVVRVMVPGREPPTVTLNPGDVDQIEIVARDPEKTTPTDRRARRALFFRGGAIKRAVDESAPSMDIGDAAQDETGNFVVDESGRHLSRDEYNSMVAKSTADRVIVGKRVGDQKYLVQADGTVYKIDESGELFKLGEEGADEAELRELAAVADAPARRVAIAEESPPGSGNFSSRPVTVEDLDADMFPQTHAFEALEGEPDTSGLNAEYWDQVEAQRGPVTLESMGLKSVADFDPRRTQTFSNERVIGGMKFVDLDRDADEEPFSDEQDIEVGAGVPDEQTTDQAMAKAEYDALTPEQKQVIEQYNEAYRNAPPDNRPQPPEGYEITPNGLRPVSEAPITEQIDQSAAEVGERPDEREDLVATVDELGLPTERESASLTDEEESTIRTWTAQSQDANRQGLPGPEVPEGYVLVEGRGLQPERMAPSAEPAPTREATDVDVSAVDMDVVAPPPAQPAPVEAKPVEVLSDEDIDALSAPPPRIEDEFPPPPPTAELPADVEDALRATPESEEAKEAEAAEAKRKADAEAAETADPDPVGTALDKAAIEEAAGDPKSKGEIKTDAPARKPTDMTSQREEIAAKAKDIAAQLEAKKAPAPKTTKKERIKNVFTQIFGDEDPFTEEKTDAVQVEGQNKVKSTPPVVGQNTEPAKTPEPKEASTFSPDDVARDKEALEALRNAQLRDAITTRNTEAVQ